MKGPYGKFRYLSNGNFSHLYKGKWAHCFKKNFFCIAGGSGITPIWQIIDMMYNNEEFVNVTLIQGNKTPQDIWMYYELLQMGTQLWRPQIKIVFLLDNECENMKTAYETGFVRKELVDK